MSGVGLHVDVDVKLPGAPFPLRARFDAPRGVTVLFGPSAAGKTLLLRLLAGLLPLPRDVRNNVTLNGTVLDDGTRSVPAHQRSLGYAPQQGALWPHRNVREHLRAITDETRAGEMLAALNLEPLALRKPQALSGGERQRVALARALARRPELLLLDEPLTALDRTTRAKLGQLVADETRRTNAVTLLVTHDLAEARALADHVVRIDEGTAIDGALPAE